MTRFIKLAFKNQFFLFIVVVGGINTLFGYGVFSLLIFIGLHYVFAVFLGTIIGILFNFKTTGCIVFKSKNNRLIIRFFAVYIITYIINVAYLSLFIPYCNVYLLGAISILPLALLSYFLNKHYVFTRVESRA